jgi:hypothetical protein
MTKARILADFISDGSSLADGTISVAEVSGAAPLASPTFTGTVVADGNLTLGSSTNAFTLARLDHENVGGKAELQLNAHGSASFSMLSNFTGSTVNGVATGNFGLITPHNAGISINTSGLERMKIDGSGNTVFNEGGVDADFRVESDTNANMLFVDAGNNRVGVGATPMTNGSTFQVTSDSTESTNMQLTLRGASDTNKQMIMGFDTTANTAHVTTQIAGSAPTPLIFKTGNVVFNEASSDSDFRVESDGNTHAFFVNAGNSRVGINEDNPVNTLQITEVDDNNSNNSIYHADFSSGPMLSINNPYSGAVPSAQQTKIAGVKMVTVSTDGYGAYGHMHVESKDYAGYDAGDLVFSTGANSSGLLTERLRMNKGEAVFNDTGTNTDFRVESDTNTHALFVRGAGGYVTFGTSSLTGDSANSTAVMGGFFTTKWGSTAIASSGVWTTVHTFAANAGNFMVSMRASGTGNSAHNSVGVAVIQAGNVAFDYIRNGGGVQIRMSGYDLQVYQNVFAGANINWGVTNLGP